MLLVGTYKQGGGESIEALLACNFRRFCQTKFETVLAASGFVSGYPAEIFNHVIVFGQEQRQVCLFGQSPHSLKAAPVFHKGVNVRVIPEGADIITLLPPVVNGIGGTVGTAAMNQNRLHFIILALSGGGYQGLMCFLVRGTGETDYSPSCYYAIISRDIFWLNG